MSQGHNLDAQAEDSPEVQEAMDLYMLYATGKQLLGSDRLPAPLAQRLEDLVRAIAGCSICGEMLGARHGARCGLVEGFPVASCDLGHVTPQNAPKRDIAPF